MIYGRIQMYPGFRDGNELASGAAIGRMQRGRRNMVWFPRYEIKWIVCFATGMAKLIKIFPGDAGFDAYSFILDCLDFTSCVTSSTTL
jgi:hypothetical protein